MCWKISASIAQDNITINITGKDDLVIKCSITNYDLRDGLRLIQLKRKDKETGNFINVVSILKKDSKIYWTDKVLEKRASANGTVEEAELRLFIGKESVQCFTDFTEYKCGMEGYFNSTLRVNQETAPVPASNIHTCTCTYVYIKYDKSYSYMY